jgi:hypothetical protein
LRKIQNSIQLISFGERKKGEKKYTDLNKRKLTERPSKKEVNNENGERDTEMNHLDLVIEAKSMYMDLPSVE